MDYIEVEGMITDKIIVNEHECETSGKKWYWCDEKYKDINNEDLVILIQGQNLSCHWDELDKRTAKLYNAVLRDKVNDFYRENMPDDIKSVLKIGWIKAVKSYDISRATCSFVPYCSFIMNQAYVMFAKRITEEKVGNSVRSEYDIVDPNTHHNSIATVMMASEFFNPVESNDYVDDMLSRLNNKNELQSYLVRAHCIEGKTQRSLSALLKISQCVISRNIKNGLAFLAKEIEKEKKLF